MKNLSLLLLVVLMGAACAEHPKTGVAPVAAKPAPAPDQKATSEAPSTDQTAPDVSEESAEFEKASKVYPGYGFAVSQIKTGKVEIRSYYFRISIKARQTNPSQLNSWTGKTEPLPSRDLEPVVIAEFGKDIKEFTDNQVLTGSALGKLPARSIFISKKVIDNQLKQMALQSMGSVETLQWYFTVEMVQNLRLAKDLVIGKNDFKFSSVKSETISIQGKDAQAYVWGAKY